ncbi:FAD binding domain-containing protein [Azospirillum rugosum]|uniref:2-polyprenyl-6-methoxyphenol hydroxylase-like FAD-dependent oxidoreductase n=1 Tax=Azospirillum rugosum TaxID=416170 RepID=A0ABS4SM81_9PROT|nr:FAD-dependent monooxygenase [Azospirillum rugosum]MBP2293630.1 2-polyprenyl-6-methoxyphenol hydroxylase-like FAD-dependent oxidoreductase [Azospirillum rugosum]MDQ0527175.1 2-polyprenyl-6-methoxyphenol hydroxylase-like FAD-dependent oxidoreductase [Azospirillum rugosum]
MNPLRVRIVGGSVGGLFAAALLRQQGHDVRLYERSTGGLAGRGAGLVGQRDLFDLLRAVGCERVAQVGVVAWERIFLNRAGGIDHRQKTPQTQISWDHLYRTMRGKVADAEYELGRAVRAVEQDEGSARLLFEDGAVEEADLVIGADGLGSVVRTAVVGDRSANRYAGYVAWRGLVPEGELPEAAAMLLERFAFYDMPRSHALGYLVAGPGAETEAGARRYNWVWYRPIAEADLPAVLTDAEGRRHPFSLAPGQMPRDVAERLRRDAADQLPPPFAAAVAAEPRPFLQAIFDYEAPEMALGRVALLGDAAFVVRPHTAMGVAKAAGDAMTLHRQLTRHDRVPDALQAYNRERHPAGAAVAAYGRRLGATLE